MQTVSQQKFKGSAKNLKNLKLSTSVNKKIESYLRLFSPKSKNLQNHNLSKDGHSKELTSNNIVQKSGLKVILF